MAAQRTWRVLLSLFALQALGFLVRGESDLVRGEIVRGKPMSATSTCGMLVSEKYCYSTGEATVTCGICSGDDRIDSVIGVDPSLYWLSAVLHNNEPADEHVNITIDLVQRFQIHQITVTTAFTPLPAVWVIEGSQDGGRHYDVLKYLVSEATQCSFLFGLSADKEAALCVVQEPTRNDLSEKTNVSFGNVVADHIRLRFISLSEPKNLGQFEEFSRYYTLKAISIKGAQHSERSYSHKRIKKQACYCSQRSTVGYLCNAPGNGKFCPCRTRYGGKRCSKCARGLYDYPNCKACGCSREGSLTAWCKRSGGKCRCKPLIDGRTCNKCFKGYSGFPNKCTWCGCHLKHTIEQVCDSEGKCLCKDGYDGKACGKCKLGYTGYPVCKKQACFCTLVGSTSTKCNSRRLCQCKKGYRGAKCNQCSEGFFGYPNCKECACHVKGALFSECDSTSGRCVCYPNMGGRSCDRCISGYFGFPRCRSCTCNPYGTKKGAQLGNSNCASGKAKFKCQCKQNVGGAICDVCKDLHYSFSPINPLGCKSCGCFKSGTIGGLESCDQDSGQCACKPFMEEGKCHECRRGYHSLKATDTFGCSACKCNPGGARYGNCDKRNGKCQCRKNIGGFLCDRTVNGPVYVPSLHHISVEMEVGRRLDGERLKYRFDINNFPSFSWKGYVPFSPEQPTALLSITIPHRSVYRILFRCIFEPVGYPTTTTVTFTISPSKGVSGFSRVVSMTIKSTRNGRKERSALLALSQDDIEEEFLMFTGVWTVTIACESKYLLMDYLVFMPEEYYDGTMLQTQRADPCIVDGPKDTICDIYSYPDVTHESVVKFEAENGFFSKKAWNTDEKQSVKYYRNNKVLKQLGANGMVLMNKDQNRFTVEINIPKSGYYVFVVHYYCPGHTQEKIDIYVHRERGSIHIVPCVYQFGCRQVVMKDVNVVKIFDINSGNTPINLFTSEDANIAIDYIKAIPYELWHPIYITPALVCRSLNGKCITSQYEEATIFKRLATISKSTVNPFTSPRLGKKVVKFSRFFNPRRDDFKLVVQYKQTANVFVDATMLVITYSTVSQATVRFKYCPSKEFCRVVIQPESSTTGFKIPQGTTSISLRLSLKKDVQISWLYIIRSSSYTDNVLSLAPFDNSKAFVEQCSRNNYVINPTDKGYCMESSFALTTHFNNGALPCRCSYYGSRSRYCNKVYGQCVCRRPNIIGRQCTQCASGYYGFPFCRRCACDPRGAENGNCDYLGRCKCKGNFSGISCNRCKAGFFNFPTCKACSCSVHGSLSTFCTSSGQCQCRRSFDGKTCDKCRIGFFGFPDCKECNCDASGIKPVEDLPSGCNSSNAVKCTCKDNVHGAQCDTCRDYHYNLQFNNPKGCQKCTCSSLGTNGQLKNCDKVSGQCPCKPHANGQSCAVCKDGFTALKDYSMFGCKGCECDNGGSLDNTCNKITGTCSCRRNVAGEKCTSVKSGDFYVRNLHHVRAEFEDAKLPKGKPVTVRHSEREFPGFSGRGYMPATAQQSLIDVIVSIPRPSKYRLLIRYILASSTPVFGQVTISPTDEWDPLPQGYESVQVVAMEFTSTATRSKTYANFLTVKRKGRNAEFFLTRGKWRISLFVYPSRLLLDYFVMLPEDYYTATRLRKRVQKPCTAEPTSEDYCVEYKHLDISNTNAITVATKLGQLVGQRVSLPYAPLQSVVLNQRSQLYLPLPIPKVGEYVLIVTYYQVVKRVSELIVGMTSGFTDQTARIPTFQCKYSFGCRQVAINDKNKVMSFYLFSNTRNLLSIGAQATVAVKSVSIIPYEIWNMEYLIPDEHCVKMKGKCVQTTYNIPQNAIRVDAEKSGRGMKPSLAMDHSVRAAYLAGDGVSLRIKSRIDHGRYKVFVHYFQPSYGAYNGRIIVESGRSTALSLPFKHCPNVGGCRALARDKTTGMSRSLYIYDNFDVTISIPTPNELWIDYILFVPIRQYNPSMEHPEPVSLARKFLKDCSKNNYIINKSSSKFCQQSMFTITTQFNQGVAACDCNRKGAVSTVCDKLGGQCRCKRNIVGRECNRCKGGYTGFPNCRRV